MENCNDEQAESERRVAAILTRLSTGGCTLAHLKSALRRGRKRAKKPGYVEGCIFDQRLDEIERAIEIFERQRNE